MKYIIEEIIQFICREFQVYDKLHLCNLIDSELLKLFINYIKNIAYQLLLLPQWPRFMCRLVGQVKEYTPKKIAAMYRASTGPLWNLRKLVA